MQFLCYSPISLSCIDTCYTGVGYTPEMLQEQIAELKGYLNDKNAPFGVDLLIPQVGGNARKTKYGSTLYCETAVNS